MESPLPHPRSPRHPRFLLVGVAAACVILLSRGAARGNDAAAESALRAVWDIQRESTTNLGPARAAAESFLERFPASPLTSAARGLLGWHALKADDARTAGIHFNVLLDAPDSGALAAAGQETARRWLSRMDRDRVCSALRLHYQDAVRFPDTLGELRDMPEELRPPLTDRWGNAWAYRPQTMKRITGALNQRYVLQSSTLKDRSDLVSALAAPYALKEAVVLAAVLGTDNRRALNVQLGGRPAALDEGATADGIRLVFLGETIALFSDGDCWDVRTLPEGGD
jgi:hypothetical protein